jgi:hypothetical protein
MSTALDRNIPSRRPRRRRGRVGRALLGLLALSGAVAVLPATSLAGGPRSETFTFSDPFSGSFDCGGFEAAFSGHDHGRVTTWFDGDGNPLRQQGKISAVETDVNLSTGASIKASTQLNVHVDFVAGTTSITGIRNLSTEPGRGVVVQHVGRVVSDSDGNQIFLRGKYPEFVAGYMSEDWCAALS